ncbi:MAG: glycosyltransferase [Planctomycetota bacterium]|nr:glycosyltransferase [Planctomycetota bacterium]
MIFVTVGTQLPFDRLVRAVDSWLLVRPGERGFAQVGKSELRPLALTARPSLSPREYEAMCRASDLIVAHAGIGSLLSAIRHRKRLIVMARSAAHGEHRNDHQRATAERIRASGWAAVAEDEFDLRRWLDARDSIPVATGSGSDRLSSLVHELRSWIHA